MLELQNIQKTPLSSKSWTAYIQPVVANFFFALIVGALVNKFSPGFAVLVIVGFLANLVYVIFYLLSYRLYYDEEGVWYYSGVFPWQKGSRGVNWRDMEGAEFFPGFTSWLFKSYTITIKNRFTESNSVVLSDMIRGEEAVKKINSLHQELVRSNLLN